MLFRICRDCEIHHYKNCPVCKGFGIRKERKDGKVVPITYEEAIALVWLKHDLGDKWTISLEWEACPRCESTPRGVPTRVKEVHHAC